MNSSALLATGLVLAAGVQAAPADAPAARTEAREIFATITAIETAAGAGQVPRMAQYLAGLLLKAGFAAADVHVVPLGETASLVARYRGNGTGGRPIALLAHMDVVPAKRTDWQRDPFTLIEEHGFFYGRGTADVKNEVALLAETFLRLRREQFVPTRDLILVFTGDEETEEATTADLLANHHELVDAEFALNGDGGFGMLDEQTGRPVLYYLQGAEKTSVTFTLTTRNPGGHSSRPHVDNAIYELADALKAVQRTRLPVMSNEWTIGELSGSGRVTPGALGVALTRFAAQPNDATAAALWAEPGYVGKTRTTCVATMLAGGHAPNALPQSATATVNCRIFPGHSLADVQKALQDAVGTAVKVERQGDPVISDASPLRADVLHAVERALAAVHPGTPIVPSMAEYATDGAYFRHAGIPTYGVTSIFIKESDFVTHGLNERLPVVNFYEGLTHWDVLIRELAGPR